MTIRQALLDATRALQPHFSEARLEASLLLEHSLQKPRSWLIAHDEEILSDDIQAQFDTLLQRRFGGEPLAYITGTKEFWSLPLDVAPDVLIPRPDTELLVETALEKITSASQQRVIDLGTGSGAIAIAIAGECPSADVTATDISTAALTIARRNADRLCPARIHFIQSHWLNDLVDRHFNVIVSNPPYIETHDPHLESLRHEPRSALTSGIDGLDDLRQIIPQSLRHLDNGGWLMVEHGATQGEAVRTLFGQNGYLSVETRHDLAGLERVTLGRKP